MKKRTMIGLIVIAGLSVLYGTGPSAYTQVKSTTSIANQKEPVVTKHASGTFDVKVTPQTDENPFEPAIGRMTIDKQYHGPLEGTGKGVMLTGSTEVKGSAVYVALERVEGKLEGKTGTFAMQHSGVMTRGTPHLVITVVPDSGTGELVGLSGKMNINIVDGKHFYEFEYTIEKAQ